MTCRLMDLEEELVGKLWPSERVVMGMRVCVWLQTCLRRFALRVLLKWRACHGSIPRMETPALKQFEQKGVEIEINVSPPEGYFVDDSYRDCNLATCAGDKAEAAKLASQAMSALEAAGIRRRGNSLVAHFDVSRLPLGEDCVKEMAISLKRVAIGGGAHLNTLNLEDTHMLWDELATRSLFEALKSFSRLTSLNLNRTEIGSENASDLIALLQSCTQLRQLEMEEEGNMLAFGQSRVQFVEALSRCTSLSYLNLKGCALKIIEQLLPCPSLAQLQLSYAGAHPALHSALAPPNGRRCGLAGCMMLSDLTLDRYRMDGAALTWLLEGLANCQHLRRLELRDCGLTPAQAELLVSLLESCTVLQHLVLCGNPMQGAALPALAASGMLQRLRGLDLAATGLARQPTAELAGARSMTSISLGRNDFGAQAGELLQCMMKGCTALRTLSLDGAGISARAVAVMAAEITTRVCLRALSKLDLEGNRLAGGGAALRTVVGATPDLASLSLGHCELQAMDVSEVARGLERCYQLERLDLKSNPIGAAAGAGLTEGFSTSLRELRLSLCWLADGGVQGLERVLAECSSMTHLDLSSNGIGEHGAECVAAAVAQLPAMARLELQNNRMGDRGLQAVASAVCVARNRSLQALDVRNNHVAMSAGELRDCFFSRPRSVARCDANNAEEEGPSGSDVGRDSGRLSVLLSSRDQ